MPRQKKISHAELLKKDKDPRKVASAAHLVYVNDKTEGISRLRQGKNFIYKKKGRPLRDKNELQRIRKLAIPPSWKEVWICALPNGHIQATGLDLRKRKQYRYHTNWGMIRSETKFHRLYEFGKALPRLRKKIRKDIAGKELTGEKVLATAIDVMEKSYIRVGNSQYEKMNGSYGLTTLKDQHVNISRDKLVFSFTGKKGIEHSITVKSKKLARTVKQCRDIPGKTLFQYYDDNHTKHAIDSGMVNNYIKEATGESFTAKDFRTWAGSLLALEFLLKADKTTPENGAAPVAMLREVSRQLGNSQNVCKKFYVLPQLISLCEDATLQDELERGHSFRYSTSLTPSENMLIYILRKYI
jgi:DNA topoisomerase-1